VLVNAPRNELIDQANVPTKRGNRPQLFGIRFLPTLESADSVDVSNSAQSWRRRFIRSDGVLQTYDLAEPNWWLTVSDNAPCLVPR